MALKVTVTRKRKEKNVLVLQGGGALGAYQAGAYEAMAAAGHVPEWIAGMSIGAINGAIIAGNPPERRVARLREFWERVSSLLTATPFLNDDNSRKVFGEASAAFVATTGVPGFFEPRFPPAVFMPRGSPSATSVYDTAPLLGTLHELVDFDLLNSGAVRLSVGAVNVRTANLKFFDTAEQEVRAEHIMASAALPPGFPPVVIDEEPYWDGALVSNTPLHHVLEGDGPRADMCIFQLDLFSAEGPVPESVFDIAQREKEIRYSSRTRLNTDISRDLQEMRRAIRRLRAPHPGRPAQASRLEAARQRSAATPPSPSCISSTAARPTGRSPTTTSSPATPWRSTGAPAAPTSSTRSIIRPGKSGSSPRRA